MKKLLLCVAALGFLTAERASADYVLIKINLNQLNFIPGGQLTLPGQMAGGAGAAGGQPQPPNPNPGGQPFPPGGAGGGVPFPPGGAAGGGIMPGMGFGFQGGPPPGGQPPMPPQPPGSEPGGMPPVVEDPNPKWVSAYAEVRFTTDKEGRRTPLANTPFGVVYEYDHKWSTARKNWLILSPHFPMFAGMIPQEPFAKEFDPKFAKAKKDKNIEDLLHLARTALSRGQMREFHRAMKEADNIRPSHEIVKNYQRVAKDLQRAFKDNDPAQVDLIADLIARKYTLFPSEKGHYRIYAQVYASDRNAEAMIKRRLEMMEETLESFYYWFAMQPATPQPAFPKYRLMAVMANTKEEFLTRHVQWGSVPMVADGFTPRRDNIMVLSAKARITDPRYAEFETMLNSKIADVQNKLGATKFNINFKREDLLSGKIQEDKRVGAVGVYVAAAQTAVLLSKVLEEENLRATISHEATRQLLVASEMFPRNVQIPEWMIGGLASFFETPVGAVYPTIGERSWTHMVSFKHLRSTKRLDGPADSILFNVVTDRYFEKARQLHAEAQDNRDTETLRQQARQATETARCTSWAFIYYLAQTRKLDTLFRYGKELDKLPRDMDLNELILQACFARAFEMTDPQDARRIEREPMRTLADSWFAMMQETNLEREDLQTYLLQQRAQQDAGVAPVPTPPPVQPGVGNPNPGNPNPAGPVSPAPGAVGRPGGG